MRRKSRDYSELGEERTEKLKSKRFKKNRGHKPKEGKHRRRIKKALDHEGMSH